MLDSKSFALPCGGIAEFDEGSGCAHRCWTCMAVVGSVAMPRRCQELLDKEDELRAKEDLVRRKR